MSHVLDLTSAIVVCLILILLSYIGFVYMSIDKKKLRMDVCIKQIKSQLDIWVAAVLDLSKNVVCDETVARNLEELATEYTGLKKNAELPKRVHLINQIYEQLLKVEGYSPFGNPLNLTFETVNRIEVIAKEYNKSTEEMNSILDKKSSAMVGKLFHIQKAERLSIYFEEMFQ